MRITVENLSFSYTERLVLRDINFQVSQGEILCIVGPNGSGKSTLVKCLACLLKKQSGRILFDGVDAGRLGPGVLARRIGYMAQANALCFATTVFETVLMGRRPYSSWYSSKKDIRVVAGILERMGLEQNALQNVNCLSGGQQQRVFIARALAQEPQALLLDEPTSSLDIAHQMDTMEAIRLLARKQQISVIMILHDLNLAARYADRVVMLFQGGVHAIGEPEQVFTANNMATVYGVKASIQKNKGIVSILPVERCFPIDSHREKQR